MHQRNFNVAHEIDSSLCRDRPGECDARQLRHDRALFVDGFDAGEIGPENRNSQECRDASLAGETLPGG